MTDLNELLARIRAAKGPDRILDDDVWRALCWDDHWRYLARGEHRFTASVDACIALAERVLPGVRWGISSNFDEDESPYWVTMESSGFEFSTTPALAFLAAILYALIATSNAEGASP